MRKRDRLSYGQIKKHVNVSKSTLTRWLKDFPLHEEEIKKMRQINWTKGEASRERFRETMRNKRELAINEVYDKQREYFSKPTKRERFSAGLMLYLAEGSKSDRYTIVLTNTDSKILKFFILWLNEFLGIQKKALHAQLHLYENMDLEKERKYWENVLGLERAQFYKDQIRIVKENTYSYSEGHRHGTCQVSYCKGAKKMLLTESIRAFMDNCYKEK